MCKHWLLDWLTDWLVRPSKLMINLSECRSGRIISKKVILPRPWGLVTLCRLGRWSRAGMRCPDLWCLRKSWHLATVAAGWSARASGHITILIHPLSLRPPELQQATESCSHSNGQACWCPWGSFLDRIPRRPLSVKGQPLCWMAVYLCRRVSFSVPRLPSPLSLLFSSSSPLIFNAKTHL